MARPDGGNYLTHGNAPSQKLQDCRIAELQEGLQEGLPQILSAILQFCNPAIPVSL
jgi:hypothetical protein